MTDGEVAGDCLWLVVVVAATSAADEVGEERDGATDALAGRQHVEWHRQRARLVDVRHPQLGPRKLPLHVAVRLTARRTARPCDMVDNWRCLHES